MNILQKMRTHGKLNAAQEKPVQPFKIIYIDRNSNGARQLPGDHIVQARSQYEAWSMAMDRFEKEFPDEDFNNYELKVEEIES